jgi:hypothetical protein
MLQDNYVVGVDIEAHIFLPVSLTQNNGIYT